MMTPVSWLTTSSPWATGSSSAADLGTVSYSEDGGDSFKVLDDISNGQVHVAFDSYFDDNGYLYAAVAGD